MARSRRDEILGVAARIFNVKGYQNATLEDVGDELGFTRAALYYYFKSKPAIVEAIVDDAVGTLMGGLRDILSEDLPPAECLRRIIVNHIVVLHARPNVFGVFLTEPTSLPENVREKMHKVEREYIELVSAVYQRGIDAGVFNCDFAPKVTVLLILGMANNTIRWFQPPAVKRRDFDPEALGELVFRMVSEGFSTDVSRGAATLARSARQAGRARRTK